MARLVIRATDHNDLESFYYVISDIPQVRQAAIDSLKDRDRNDVYRITVCKIIKRPPYYVLIEEYFLPLDRDEPVEVFKYE